MTSIVCLNGEFLDITEARVSILDRGFMYGDGLFETMRARRTGVFRLGLHMTRLEASAAELAIPLPYPVSSLENLVHETLEKNALEDSIVRLQITRGESEPGLLPSRSMEPTLVIMVRPFQSLAETLYSTGVSVCTVPDSAASTGLGSQRLKTTNYLTAIQLRVEAEKRECFEAIALDSSGKLTEGTVSNIFLVKGGVVSTPRLNKFILSGITRQVIREICSEEKISFLEEDVLIDSAREADEMFLTNTGAGVLPVAKLDTKMIGKGVPGPVARQLSDRYLNIFDTEMGS